MLALVKAFLKAGILTELGDRKDTTTGTPQGGILSPLLANIALSVLDEHLMRRGGRADRCRPPSSGGPAPNGLRQLAARPLRRRLCATNADGGCDVEDRADSDAVLCW